MTETRLIFPDPDGTLWMSLTPTEMGDPKYTEGVEIRWFEAKGKPVPCTQVFLKHPERTND